MDAELVISPPEENNKIKLSVLEKTNKQLAENQEFLYDENIKLREELLKITKQLHNYQSPTVNSTEFDQKELQNELINEENDYLKEKIKRIKNSPISSKNVTKEMQQNGNNILHQTIAHASNTIDSIQNQFTESIEKPENNTVNDSIALLKVRLETQIKKRQNAEESLSKYKINSENQLLQEKIVHLKQLISQLEIENIKLRLESEQLTEAKHSLENQIKSAQNEVEQEIHNSNIISMQTDQLKFNISEIENENLRLKKEMIDELNEANKAKRLSMDAEIKLQRISEAYEAKKKDLSSVIQKLDRAKEKLAALQREQSERRNKLNENDVITNEESSIEI